MTLPSPSLRAPSPAADLVARQSIVALQKSLLVGLLQNRYAAVTPNVLGLIVVAVHK